ENPRHNPRLLTVGRAYRGGREYFINGSGLIAPLTRAEATKWHLHHNNHQNVAQCPPVGACPEPAAISGGSMCTLTGSETAQSHAKKPISANQKAANNIDFFILPPTSELKMAADANTDQRPQECHGNPNPAVQATRRDAADHGANIATKSQARAIAQ